MANHFLKTFSSRLLLPAYSTEWATYCRKYSSPGQITHDGTLPHFVEQVTQYLILHSNWYYVNHWKESACILYSMQGNLLH